MPRGPEGRRTFKVGLFLLSNDSSSTSSCINDAACSISVAIAILRMFGSWLLFLLAFKKFPIIKIIKGLICLPFPSKYFIDAKAFSVNLSLVEAFLMAKWISFITICKTESVQAGFWYLFFILAVVADVLWVLSRSRRPSVVFKIEFFFSPVWVVFASHITK